MRHAHPVSLVGYGGVGGARAVEQLRLNAIELQMAPIRTAVHIQFPVYLAVVKEGKKLSDFDFLNQEAKAMLDQLTWWTQRAEGSAREGRASGRIASSTKASIGVMKKPLVLDWSHLGCFRRLFVSGASARIKSIAVTAAQIERHP
jgi:hypothetical protein